MTKYSREYLDRVNATRQRDPEKYRAYQRLYRLQHLERERERSRERDRLRPSRSAGDASIAYRVLAQAKRGADKKNVPFDLDLDFVRGLEIPDICPILGIRMFFIPKETHAGTPSLDRLVPCRGYVKGNVWFISKRANQLKSDATVAELEKILLAAKAIEKLQHKDF